MVDIPKILEEKARPMKIMPPVYAMKLPGPWGRCCRLGEICDIAQDIMKEQEKDFEANPQTLVERFCALTRKKEKRNETKRLFLYSPNGRHMKWFEITEIEPPIPSDFSRETFVLEDWARDTLEEIFDGGVRAINLTEKMKRNLKTEKDYMVDKKFPKNPGA
jgi:hypothetical protein